VPVDRLPRERRLYTSHGIFLEEPTSAGAARTDLSAIRNPCSPNLSAAMDRLNACFGTDTITLASQGRRPCASKGSVMDDEHRRDSRCTVILAGLINTWNSGRGGMTKTAALAALCLLPSMATAQITPGQDAQIKRVLREVVEMDEELKSIQSNQPTLQTNKAARHDEYNSLVTRYPGIEISDGSSAAEMYRALHQYRMRRAATVKPLVDEQVRASRVQSCDALEAMQAERTRLEATDGYKRAKLQDRIELRKAFDDLIAEASTEGDPCSPSADD
jgi:hypothetical protein